MALINPLNFASLLNRPEVSPSLEDVAYLAGLTVLVTGAGGSIGSELCRQTIRAGAAKVIMLDHSECGLHALMLQLADEAVPIEALPMVADVRDVWRLREVFQTYRPDMVLHAAAYKHVPLMETCPVEAVMTNVEGTVRVITEALAVGCRRIVFISTDKAVHPASIMGATKRLAELWVQDKACESQQAIVAVRFGNVLGSSGSVVQRFQQQVARGGPVTVTHPDMMRYFMTVREAASLVLTAGGLGRGGELFLLDMGDPMRIMDLAQRVAQAMGRHLQDVGVQITGLRPGERLEEHLLEEGAWMEATRHPKISLVKGNEAAWLGRAVYERIRMAIAHNDAARVRKMLMELATAAVRS
jgi:FlaA1/EpsC-like NDP-sugar epimerase